MEVFQPIAGNYYPVNAAIYVEDEESSMAVLNDRTQGGASLSPGSIELMVQRRTKADDSRGVGEPMDETTGGMNPYPPWGDNARVGTGVIIKGTHRIYVGEGLSGATLARSGMDSMFSPLNMFFAAAPASTESDIFNSENGFVGIGKHSTDGASPLPPQVALITLQKVYGEEGVFFVRLAHQFAVGENEKLSADATVDLASVLPKGLQLDEFVEMTLTGNAKLSEREEKKLHWKSQGGDDDSIKSGRSLDADGKVVFKAMEMRSFRLKASRVDESKLTGWN